jgi:hypothetical protein
MHMQQEWGVGQDAHGNLKGKDLLEDLGAEKRIILK